MAKKDKNAKFNLWEVIAITLFSSLIMSFCTGYLVFKGYGCGTFISSEDDKYVTTFTNSYKDIVDNYYSSVDKEELIDSAIKGMLNYLGDPYTTYLDKEGTESLTDSLSGTYQGIGIGITFNGDEDIYVTKVYEDTPAEKVGIKVGDILVSVNGESLDEKTPNDVTLIIKNYEEVVLLCKRDGEEIEFKLKKTTLDVPSVNSKVVESNDKKIGYMIIDKFNQTVYDQFKKQLNSIEKDNIDGLIIDLRNNTGGYLNAASKMAELFLKDGKTIYSLNEKSGNKIYEDKTLESRSYPISVLVNGNTASASEILAAALRDSYGAKLVGSKTYGKGKVQKTSKLSNGTMYKYTSAKWLTPDGECIDEVGLIPDLEVNYLDDLTVDLVYEKALEDISK